MALLSSTLLILLHSPWLWSVVAGLTLYWIYMRAMISYFDSSIDRTDGWTYIITGAEQGIGRETTDLLASRGGRIIMACKDVNLGQAARDAIMRRTGNKTIEVHHLDLSSLSSVRKFASEIRAAVDKLDVLVHNAAIACGPMPGAKTADGLNTIMQVNHFGPFLLTNLLLDLIKKSAPSRIVFVSSVVHQWHKFSLDNLNCEKELLSNCRVYCNSKLANILTARYFARVLQGTGVTVNSLHPGMTKTSLVSNCSGGSIFGMLVGLWFTIFAKSPREGAMTPAFVASENKLTYITGEHFSECKVSGCVAKIADCNITQERLFEKSRILVGLKNEELFI